MTLSNKITYNRFIFLCLVVFSIIPDIGIKFSTAGFTWTAYRAVAMLCLCTVLIGSEVITIEFNKTISRWISFMAFWVVYGLILLFIGKYTDTHNGFIEWLSIFNGLIIFYTLSRFLNDREKRDTAVTILYWLLNLMVVVGIAEIVTGRHWITSVYQDHTSVIYQFGDMNMATGFMYNMNDFSAFITCMTPVLLVKRLGKKRLLTLIGVILINLRNDANLCNIAISLFIVFYFLILQGGKTYKAIQIKAVLWTLAFCFVCLFIVFGVMTTSKDSIAFWLYVNKKISTGSLHMRMTIYRDAFKAWLSTGMLGMGPSGFSNYFIINRSTSGLFNPHSLILEVLSQYGIIVCSWFVLLLFRMYRLGRQMYEMPDEHCKEAGLMVVAFVIIYFIASFAPSTFIGYSYQWLLLAIMSSMLNYSNETGEKNNA